MGANGSSTLKNKKGSLQNSAESFFGVRQNDLVDEEHDDKAQRLLTQTPRELELRAQDSQDSKAESNNEQQLESIREFVSSIKRSK